MVSERAVEKHVGNSFSKLGLAPSDADHRRVLTVLLYLGVLTSIEGDGRAPDSSIDARRR